MNTETQRTCRAAATSFLGAMEFCPVCMLRKVLAGGVESGESSASADTVNPTTPKRFEHYELVTGEDGKPVELWRGAMGVTYEAFERQSALFRDTEVICERYLGDETARLRFLREARAAASVRHPHVASVFHLGTIGQNYFYAMEFRRGRNARKAHQTLRSAGDKVGAANRVAGRRRFDCGTQTEAGSPGYQTE